MLKSGLYGISDIRLMPDDNLLLQKVEQALQGGMTLFQYRDKKLSPEHRSRQALLLKALCQNYQVPLIINDDLQLAKEVAADGVHLGKEDASLAEARDLLGPKAIIGVSCYNNLDFAKIMALEGADYVAFGAVFPSDTKPQAKTVALSIIEQAIEQLPIPVVTIGGINASNIMALKERGVQHIAVVQGLFDVADVQGSAKMLTQALCE